MAPLLALLLHSSPVTVYLQETADLDAGASRRLLETIAAAVESRTGRTAVVGQGPGCAPSDSCAEGRDTIFVRAFRGVLGIRVTATRSGRGEPERVKIPHEEVGWALPLESLVGRLFPERSASAPPPGLAAQPPPPPPIVPARPAPEESGGLVWPWAVLGVSAAVAILGVGFGVSSRTARSDLESNLHSIPEAQALSDRVSVHGTAANALFVVAVFGTILGVTPLIGEAL